MTQPTYQCEDCGASITANQRLCDECYQAETEALNESYVDMWRNAEDIPE